MVLVRVKNNCLEGQKKGKKINEEQQRTTVAICTNCGKHNPRQLHYSNNSSKNKELLSKK